MTPTCPYPMSSCAVPGLPSALLPPSPIPVPPVLCPAAAHAVTVSPKQAPEGRIPPVPLPCHSPGSRLLVDPRGRVGRTPAASLCTAVGRKGWSHAEATGLYWLQ